MAEIAFDVGMLAEHSRMADWGPGKVVKVRAPYVWVFFRDAPGRAARQFPASLLVRSACQRDTVLDNLPAFIEKDGTQVLPAERSTLREALAIFRSHAPAGFAGTGSVPAGSPKLQKDHERRRAAHEAWLATLGGGQAQELLAAGDVAQLTTRVLGVVALARALPSADLAAFREGLQDKAAARDYFSALLDFLAAEPAEPSFAAYAAAAGALTAGRTTWPTLTLLPSLAQPLGHMLLHPTSTCPAAQRLGFALSYEATPNWPTYEALCRLGGVYLEALKEAGARDLLDVHFFLATLVVKSATRRAPPA